MIKSIYDNNSISDRKYRHDDYVILNDTWRYIRDMPLNYCLDKLGVNDIYHRFVGINLGFYLRHRINIGGTCDVDVDLDPWNRKFTSHPEGSNFRKNFRDRPRHHDCHKYFITDYSRGNNNNGYHVVYVIVTTVNGERVYCVDQCYYA